jgi:hypothetical protein
MKTWQILGNRDLQNNQQIASSETNQEISSNLSEALEILKSLQKEVVPEKTLPFKIDEKEDSRSAAPKARDFGMDGL